MVRGRGKHNKEIPAAKLGLATWCPRTDCFACKGEACTALRNTDFGDKPCPFFKSRARYIEELKLVEEVNARHRAQYKVAMMSELGTPGTPKKKRAKHSDESNNE